MADERTQTAAGLILVIKKARSKVRNTDIFFGIKRNGIYVTASRFQVEKQSKFRAKAEKCFNELIGM